MDEKKVIGFLTELTELTRKYGLRVGGCGCCGSPYLTEKGVTDSAFYSIDVEFASLVFTEEDDDRICGRKVKADA